MQNRKRWLVGICVAVAAASIGWANVAPTGDTKYATLSNTQVEKC